MAAPRSRDSRATQRFGDMGEVATLRGMKISIFTKGEERHPPHFHLYQRAGYGLGRAAQIDIETGAVLAGPPLPSNVRRELLRWLNTPGVREALRENWRRARAGLPTVRIVARARGVR